MHIPTAASLALAPFLGACAMLPTIYGSGVRAEEDRAVADFHAIELDVSADVEVRVGEVASLWLSCDDDLLPLITTDVHGGVLEIDLPNRYEPRAGLRLIITTPALDRFEFGGSSDVRIENVQSEEFHLSLQGSGDMEVDGSVKRLRASIEGSGDLRLGRLRSQEAEVSIAGSGKIEVQVAYELQYRISGSGDIRYIGNPSVSGRISGSGSVLRDS